MIRRSILIAGFCFLAQALAPAFPATADLGPAGFIWDLGNQGLGVIRSSASTAEKEAYFLQLLRQDFDVAGIARFVLGPYWRVASAPQQQKFRTLLDGYLVRVYGRRFTQYRGGALRVTGSRSDPEGALVTSEIVRPQGGPPIAVDWRLDVRDGRYKIRDVVIDGISMAVTERSEFAQAIVRSGGRIAGLLATMREELGEGAPA